MATQVLLNVLGCELLLPRIVLSIITVILLVQPDIPLYKHKYGSNIANVQTLQYTTETQ